MRHVCIGFLLLQAVASAQTASSVSLIASPNPANYGQPVTLTATVTSGATGKVTFYDGVTILGVGTLSGTQASITTVMLASGNRSLRAYYQGDSNFAPSRSAAVPLMVAAGASLGLNPPASVPPAQYAIAMAVADFNGDNRQDIALVSEVGAQAAVYLGNGDGTFQSALYYPAGATPQLVAVADFNQDGIPDLAIGSASAATITLLLGNGDGTFHQGSVLTNTGATNSIVVGDFDGDGKADLVLANDFSDSVEMFLGNGDGTFGGVISVPAGSPTTSVAVADFNGDGKADLVVTSSNAGNVAVLLGNGDGTFQSPLTQTVAPALNSVIVTDFNRDGKPDIAVWAPSEEQPEGGMYGIFVMLGNGDGTFGAPSHYFPEFFAGSVLAEDFNGDGIPDLAVTDLFVSNGQLAIMIGNGDGTFGNLQYYTLPINQSIAVVGDFNRDGRPDIAITGAANVAFSVLLGGAVPDLTIAVNHGRGLTQGGQGQYAITVENVGGYGSSGNVTVTATLSPGLTATGITGVDWNCTLASLTCVSSDSVASGGSYPVIDLAVDVENGTETTLVSTFTVAGGGETNTANDSATDSATARYPTITNLSALPNPAALGQPVTVTATVTPGATGFVEFFIGGTLLGEAFLSGGQSTLTTLLLPSGASSLQAYYVGDANFGPSWSAGIAQTVTAVADSGVSPHQTYNLDALPIWIGAADLNGDGILDLITVQSGSLGVTNSGGVGVLLGEGNGAFRPVVTYSTGDDKPLAGVLGDFNHDGNPDVAIASSNGVFLLLGTGAGGFRISNLVISAVATTLVAADFNGDGNLDLALLTSGGITLYPGNGDGTFGQPIIVTTGQFGFLLTADFNRDGNSDLIALNGNPERLITYLGNGDGTFRQVATNLPGLETPVGITVGDFNGDGFPDVAATGNILIGNGDGTFTAGTQNVLTLIDQQPVLAGDFNGDGKMDLALVSPYNPYVYLIFGNGNGTFQGGPAFSTDSCPCTVALADFNSDGIPDFAVSNGAGTVDVFLGGQISGLTISSTHSGRFTAGATGSYQLNVENLTFGTISASVNVTDTLPNGLTASSIGGSSWNCTLNTVTCANANSLEAGAAYSPITLEVNVSSTLPPSSVTNLAAVTVSGIRNSATDATAIVVPSTTSVAVSPNAASLGQPMTLTANATGTAGSVLFLQSGLPIGTASLHTGQAILNTRQLQSGLQYVEAVYAGDASHAPSNSAETSVRVRPSPANGFAAPASYPIGATPYGVATGDFNNDGIPDLVTTSYYADAISVLLGNGDGTFATQATYTVGNYATSVVVADFNNDGQPDVAVGYQANSVSILLGNADGTFQPAQNFTTLNSTQFLSASDFNGDGKVDLVSSTNVMLGNGDGTFQSGPTFALNAFGFVGDFNLDGKMDLYTSTNQVLLGNGDGTFETATTFNGFSIVLNAAAIGDVNGDGKSDIVAASTFGEIAVLLGDGDGTFQSPLFSANNIGVAALILADVNGDGNLDIVAATTNSIAVLLGNGDGTFQSPLTYPTCYDSQAVVASDFNRDGRTDLAVTCQGAANVMVLLGVLTPTLTVSSTHSDPLSLGQTGAIYTISVNNTGPGPTSGTVTATDTLPAGVSATAIEGSGWNCTLATLVCTSTASISAGQSYGTITITAKVTATSTGSGANLVAVTGGGAPNANASDPTNIVGPAITIQTIPSGLQFTLDNSTQTAPQTINLTPGNHTLAVASPQTAPGTQYLFSNWSDSGPASHTITVGATPATYTATFQTQYQLTTATYPTTGGTVTPTAFFNAGASTSITATANPPLVFTGWSNGATTNPLPVTLNAPVSLTANFDIPGATCTMTGDATASVADVQYIVNEALGIAPANNDLNNDGVVNITDVQQVVGAVLHASCLL